MLPFIVISAFVYMVSSLVYFLSMIPVLILLIIFGINVEREQDLVTWFLGVEELGIYDPMNDPIGNMFEIPEAREYFIRTKDTGFEPKYGVNPEMKGYVDRPEDGGIEEFGFMYKDTAQGMFISNFY